MITLAITAQKGGVGKSTTAHALGVGLSRFYGKRVLLIDTDAQGNLTRTLEAARGGAAELLTGAAILSESIQHTGGGVDIIASSPALISAEATLTGKGREYRLRRAIQGASALYDYCVIDTPPALSIITINALTAADRVIIPAQADDYSIESLDRLRETIEAVQRHSNAALRIDGILLTRYNGRTNVSRYAEEQAETAAAEMGTRLYATRIRECSAIKEAQFIREDIYTYSPRSNAARDYKSLLEEITEEGATDNG